MEEDGEEEDGEGLDEEEEEEEEVEERPSDDKCDCIAAVIASFFVLLAAVSDTSIPISFNCC